MMMSQGYIKPHCPGIFSQMPLAVKSLQKLCHIVDDIMNTVHAQKVLFPTLIQDSFLKTSGMFEYIEIFVKLEFKNV